MSPGLSQALSHLYDSQALKGHGRVWLPAGAITVAKTWDLYFHI